MLDYISTLNKEQYEAATTVDGRLFVLAGAGSGKTRTLIARTAYLLQQGIPASSILLVTFTNKAADEMKARITNWIGESGENVTACTFHSFCAVILRKFHKEAGITPDFQVFDTSDSKSAIQTCINDYLNNTQEKYDEFFKPTAIEKIHSLTINNSVSIFDAISIVINSFPQYRDLGAEMYDVYNMFQEFKRENKALDFDDLQLFMYNLLSSNEAVRAAIDKHFKYISCDEYQDTNIIQNKVLELISVDYPNLCVVGDDNQSIYSFRGANIDNILNFSKSHPDCKTVVLNRNYRSTQEILDLANSVMNHATEGIEKKLVSADGISGPTPKKISLLSDRDEPARILKEIKQNNLDLSKTAIIYRNNGCSPMLESLLNREGIPYDKRGGMRFNEKRVVKDILALLRLSSNPEDQIAAIRILPLIPGLGGTTARKLALGLKAAGLEALVSLKNSQTKYGGVLQVLYGYLTAVQKMPIFQAVDRIAMFYMELRKYALSKSTASASSIQEQKNELLDAEEDIEILKNMAEGYSSISEFITDLSLETTRKKEKGNCLVLTTIHSAKGLEWDNVFIIDCVDGFLPSSQSLREGNEAEELRCFYVAITRAKKYLCLLVPQTIRGERFKITRFLNYYDVGQALYQTV